MILKYKSNSLKKNCKMIAKNNINQPLNKNKASIKFPRNKCLYQFLLQTYIYTRQCPRVSPRAAQYFFQCKKY